jgi:hypothetical protein
VLAHLAAALLMPLVMAVPTPGMGAKDETGEEDHRGGEDGAGHDADQCGDLNQPTRLLDLRVTGCVRGSWDRSCLRF